MRHETILKRDDGSKVNIEVRLFMDNFTNSFRYDIGISICEPKKRTWHYINNSDSYSWRRLSPEEKLKFEMNESLKYVSEEEILQAKMALWELIKPT